MSRKKDSGIPRVFNIKPFDILNTHPSASFIVIGRPGSGKSCFGEDYLYFHRSRYPVAKIVSGTETETKFYGKSVPELYISNKYDEVEELKYIERQKKCKTQKRCKNPRSIHIIDDSSEDKTIYRKPVMKAFFKNGSRHWEHAFLLLLQYAIDVEPDIRKCASYIVLFYEPNLQDREKLYKNFGGELGTFKEFCDVMEQVCTPNTCMIIDNRSQSKNPEDKIFWYTTLWPRPVFRFGCEDYRKWSKKRLNKNYQPPLI